MREGATYSHHGNLAWYGFSIVFSLASVLISYWFLGDDCPRLDYEFPALLTSLALYYSYDNNFGCEFLGIAQIPTCSMSTARADVGLFGDRSCILLALARIISRNGRTLA